MATEEQGSGLQIHPMDQFVVKPLFGDGPIEWYTPTNVTLWTGGNDPIAPLVNFQIQAASNVLTQYRYLYDENTNIIGTTTNTVWGVWTVTNHSGYTNIYREWIFNIRRNTNDKPARFYRVVQIDRAPTEGLVIQRGEAEGDALESDALVSQHLDTADLPDPDLVIRTSGETRTSNFLPWQTAYAEYEFTETMWPDFTPDELGRIVSRFGARERRFGGVVGA